MGAFLAGVLLSETSYRTQVRCPIHRFCHKSYLPVLVYMYAVRHHGGGCATQRDQLPDAGVHLVRLGHSFYSYRTMWVNVAMHGSCRCVGTTRQQLLACFRREAAWKTIDPFTGSPVVRHVPQR